ncbi:MAG: hypothetical protein JW885_15165 [Deltaproteobacteria bacterium]|nr:hypothetical protein [Candidatus Zymogenaceae bacterium]
MARRLCVAAILLMMILTIRGPVSADEVYVKIHVSDVDIDATYTSSDTVYYAWMFRAWTNDFEMPHEMLAIETVYSIRLYDQEGITIASDDSSFLFTPEDLIILETRGDSIYGRYERTIFGEATIDRALWDRFSEWEVVVGASDFR